MLAKKKDQALSQLLMAGSYETFCPSSKDAYST